MGKLEEAKRAASERVAWRARESRAAKAVAAGREPGKPGRPSRAGEPTNMVGIQVTAEERARLLRAAGSETFSSWARRVLMEAAK